MPQTSRAPHTSRNSHLDSGVSVGDTKGTAAGGSPALPREMQCVVNDENEDVAMEMDREAENSSTLPRTEPRTGRMSPGQRDGTEAKGRRRGKVLEQVTSVFRMLASILAQSKRKITTMNGEK